jgi:hypothetical protein
MKSLKHLLLVLSLIVINSFAGIACTSGGNNPVTGGMDNTGDNGTGTTDQTDVDRSSQVVFYDVGEAEPNDDILNANTFFNANRFSGHVDAVSDANDYYKTTLYEDGAIYTRLSWMSSDWLNVYLYDEMLTPITYLNGDTGSAKELWSDILPAGDYYIRVKAITGSSDYSIQFGRGQQMDEPGNDNILTTGLDYDMIDGEYLISVVDEDEDFVDHIKVEVTAPQTRLDITLDWLGMETSDLDLYLYDSGGSLLSSETGSAHPKSLLSEKLAVGVYYIKIQATNVGGIYFLHVDKHELINPPPPWLFEKFYFIPIIPPIPEPCLSCPWFDFGPELFDPTIVLPPQFRPDGPFDGGHEFDMPELPQMGH